MGVWIPCSSTVYNKLAEGENELTLMKVPVKGETSGASNSNGFSLSTPLQSFCLGSLSVTRRNGECWLWDLRDATNHLSPGRLHNIWMSLLLRVPFLESFCTATKKHHLSKSCFLCVFLRILTQTRSAMCFIQKPALFFRILRLLAESSDSAGMFSLLRSVRQKAALPEISSTDLLANVFFHLI